MFQDYTSVEPIYISATYCPPKDAIKNNELKMWTLFICGSDLMLNTNSEILGSQTLVVVSLDVVLLPIA